MKEFKRKKGRPSAILYRLSINEKSNRFQHGSFCSTCFVRYLPTARTFNYYYEYVFVIYRIQVISSLCQVSCKRIEDLTRRKERIVKIFEKIEWGLYFFDENVICFVISVIDISCQFSCKRIENLRFSISDTGYVGVSRQLQTNRGFT